MGTRKAGMFGFLRGFAAWISFFKSVLDLAGLKPSPFLHSDLCG
jgi:hypothetical protein